MELLSLPKENLVDILLLLSPKSLIKFINTNWQLRSTVLTDFRLSKKYQKIMTIITNFFPITLKYLQIIKELFPVTWSFLLELKNYHYYYYYPVFTNKEELPLNEIFIVILYNKINLSYLSVNISEIKGYKLQITDKRLYNLFSRESYTFTPIGEYRQNQVIVLELNQTYQQIRIHLNRSQIDLLNSDIFDYI
jgi:hypothetical protein